MNRTRGMTLIAGVAVAALAIGACSSGTSSTGGSGTSSSGSTGESSSANTGKALLNYHGSDWMQKVKSCAESEGALSVYNANTAVDKAATAFGKAYPSIKVHKVLAHSSELLTRLKSETAAKKVGGDILDTYKATILVAQHLGYTQPFYDPAVANLSQKSFAGPTGSDGQVNWVDSMQSYSGLGYNTQKVKNPPTTLEDFLEPQYKGKFSIDGHTGGITWIGAVLDKLGTDKGNQFLEGMAKQGMNVQNVTAATMATLTASGEVVMDPDIGMADILALKAKGQPVEWAPIGPVQSLPLVFALIKGAPHPCAGLLFSHYLLSPAGQKIITGAGFISVVKGVPQASYIQSRDLKGIGAKAFDVADKYPDSETYNTNYKKWSDMQKRLFVSK